jgi:hypothetical protein
MAIRRVRSGVLAVKDDQVISQALTALIGAVAGVVASVALLWGKLREVSSQERNKREDAVTARDIRFVDMGEHLIDNLSVQVKDLQEKHDGHTQQILSLYKELHTSKMLAQELLAKVEQQTLLIQQQDLKIQEQAIKIEEQDAVIEAQAGEIHKLRWEVANHKGHSPEAEIIGSDAKGVKEERDRRDVEKG